MTAARPQPPAPALGPAPVEAWRALLGALVLQFSLGLVYVWGALAPLVRQEDHWPPLLIGAVWSAGPVGYSVGLVLAGRLADRVPPRRLCWAGLGLMATGLGVAFAFPGWLTFPLFYSLLGLGLGGGVGMAGSIAAASAAFPRRVGAVGGAVTAGYAMAALVQVPVAISLAPVLGWTGALRVLGVSLVLLAALGLAAMPALPRSRRAPDEAAAELPWRMLLRPLILTGFLTEMCAGPLGAAAFVNLAGYARGLGVPALAATAGLTAVAAGNAVGRLAAGAAADRLGVERVLRAVLLCDLAAALLLWHLGAATVAVAGLVAGLGFGGGAGLLSRLAAVAAPRAPNAAFGLVFVGYSTGSFAGPLLLGALGTGTGSWLVMGILPLAGLGVLAWRGRLAAA